MIINIKIFRSETGFFIYTGSTCTILHCPDILCTYDSIKLIYHAYCSQVSDAAHGSLVLLFTLMYLLEINLNDNLIQCCLDRVHS